MFSINNRFEAFQTAPQYYWTWRCRMSKQATNRPFCTSRTVRLLPTLSNENPPPDARSIAYTPRFTASCMQLSSRPEQRPHSKGKASRSAISGHAARHPTNALAAHELMAGVSMRGDILDSIARLGQRQREIAGASRTGIWTNSVHRLRKLTYDLPSLTMRTRLFISSDSCVRSWNAHIPVGVAGLSKICGLSDRSIQDGLRKQTMC